MKRTWLKKTTLDLDKALSVRLFPAIFTHLTHPRLSSFKEEVIIIALMHHDTAKNASKALNCSSSSMSKFLRHRRLDYIAIKTIQMFQGLSRQQVENQTYPLNEVSHARYTALNRLSNSKKGITDLYKQLMTQANAIENKSSRDFFFYTCTIAAILSSETMAIVADKMSIPESRLLHFLSEKNTDFQSIKRLHSDMQQDTEVNAIELDDEDIERLSRFEDIIYHTPPTMESDGLLSPWNSSEKFEMKQSITTHSSISWCSLFSADESEDEKEEAPALKKARTESPDLDLLREADSTTLPSTLN